MRFPFVFGLSLSLFCVGLRAAHAHGGTDYFHVRSTSDAGVGSLRQAIEFANDDPETQIAFQIPTSDPGYNPKTGVFTIRLRSPLPPVTAAGTVFDGVAQTLILDSNPSGPEVCISGALLPPGAPGLVLEARDCQVKGLSFERFPSHALLLSGPQARAIQVMGNVFENNRGCGVVLSEGASGNFIGLAPKKAKDEDGDDDFAGLYPAETGNTFRANGEDSVRVAGGSSRGNSVRGNRFEESDALPINLRLNGESSRQRTLNDALDADDGPNDALNSPTVTRVARAPREDGLWHLITVAYAGKPNQELTLDLTWDAVLAQSGRAKSQSVRTDASGNGNWQLEVRGYPAGKMRASVTDADGSTSEMSPAFDVPWLR